MGFILADLLDTIAVPAAFLAIAFIISVSYVFPVLLHAVTQFVYWRHGGQQGLQEIKERLQGRQYSLVSQPNFMSKFDIWIFPFDVGDVQVKSCEIYVKDESGCQSQLNRHSTRRLTKTWLSQESWVLDPDKEVLDAIAEMRCVLDLVEEKLGYGAARKVDFCGINIDWWKEEAKSGSSEKPEISD